MDVSSFELLGRQFRDFLTQQFSPPPGENCRLGFLGAGSAVEPDSFRSGGQFNPARVNAWLDVVVEPLAAIGGEDGHVASAPFTALSLMQSVCTLSQTTAPAGSAEQAVFAAVKSRAMEGLGGDTTVRTAPLDWYDPVHVPGWAKCHLSVASSAAAGSATSPSPPPPPAGGPARPINSRLWLWRQLQDVHVIDPVPPPLAPIPPGPMVVPIRAIPPGPMVMPIRAIRFADVSAAGSADVSVAARPVGVSRLATAAIRPDFSALAGVSAAHTGALDAEIASRIRIARALQVSRELSTAAETASTSSVATTSLTLDLSYLVVPLSREPWWNETLLALTNWYVPGLPRGGLVGEGDPARQIGMPVALVLTANVQIQANWSAADRAAAATNTHLGPWALHATQFSESSTTGLAMLTILGMQAVACIYRLLPALPPAAAP